MDDQSPVSAPVEFDSAVLLAMPDAREGLPYARELAQLVPVVSVHPCLETADYRFDASAIKNLLILRIWSRYGTEQAELLDRALRERGIRRPLIWVLNPAMADFAARRASDFILYQRRGDEMAAGDAGLLALADLLIAPSEQDRQVAVARGYSGPAIVLSGGRAPGAGEREERFVQILSRISAEIRVIRGSARRFNILVLYDDRSSHVQTIHEHLASFGNYSNNNVFYLPGSIGSGFNTQVLAEAWDLSRFDVVVVHYSIRLSLREHLPEPLAGAIETFTGLKLAFIQDEYEYTEVARRWLDRLRFDIVYTCVPPDGLEYVYPKARFPGTRFIQTLTGYVPEDVAIDGFALPIDQRRIHIGYRGRELPHHYGTLGREKYLIGVDVKRLAGERGIPVDIEVASDKRIYDSDWYRFVGSCRAVLGTESGSNIFDVDGRLAAIAERYGDRPYDEIYARYLAEHEGRVRMNQISPKAFEAIRLRTALIVFPGSYSGILEPDRHYITLQKDYSNIDEVFAKVADTTYLSELVDRAFRDIIGSGRYSYRNFVRGMDAELDRMIVQRPRAEVISVPLLVRQRGSEAYAPVRYRRGLEAALNTGILTREFSRDRLADCLDAISGTRPGQSGDRAENSVPIGPAMPPAIATAANSAVSPRRDVANVLAGPARWVWRRLPARLRQDLYQSLVSATTWQADPNPNRRGARHAIARVVWHVLPLGARRAVLHRFYR